jgi:hypothetical protein
VRQSTGYCAFELVYGRDCVLPVGFSVASWSRVNWEEVKTHEDLLVAGMKQLDRMGVEMAFASDNLRNARKANKAYFDSNRTLRRQSAVVTRFPGSPAAATNLIWVSY